MRTAVISSALLLAAADYPPLPPLDPPPSSARIQRSLRLMAASTPQHRNTVRVLFYGQSITEQHWWKDVADDLRRRFPHADLIIENRAIGGFASQLLVKTAETDLDPFQPDLLIFHVYGSHTHYEQIIRRARERTIADVLIMNDHVTHPADFDEETDPAKLRPHGPIWNAFMNHKFLPEIAARYGAELCDQRAIWKRYLKANGLRPDQLLRDGVHLNDHGCFVMAEIVKAHLRPNGTEPIDDGRVTIHQVGRDVAWTADGLELEFEGYRVDAIPADAPAGAATAVRIDGRKPTEFPGVYVRSRTTPYPNTKWPCLLRVGSSADPVAEEWTLRLTDISPDLKSFRFTLTGSVTGPDGAGEAERPFVSDSKRVTIDPADWNFEYARQVFGDRLGTEFEVRWRVSPIASDKVTAGTAPVTLAQGLPAGRHRLTLTGPSASPVREIRVYRPVPRN